MAPNLLQWVEAGLHLLVISLSYSNVISSGVTSCLMARLAHRSSIASSANLYRLLANADLKSADMVPDAAQVLNKQAVLG